MNFLGGERAGGKVCEGEKARRPGGWNRKNKSQSRDEVAGVLQQSL